MLSDRIHGHSRIRRTAYRSNETIYVGTDIWVDDLNSLAQEQAVFVHDGRSSGSLNGVLFGSKVLTESIPTRLSASNASCRPRIKFRCRAEIPIITGDVGETRAAVTDASKALGIQQDVAVAVPILSLSGVIITILSSWSLSLISLPSCCRPASEPPVAEPPRLQLGHSAPLPQHALRMSRRSVCWELAKW